jgi:hypothetical protein
MEGKIVFKEFDNKSKCKCETCGNKFLEDDEIFVVCDVDENGKTTDRVFCNQMCAIERI